MPSVMSTNTKSFASKAVVKPAVAMQNVPPSIWVSINHSVAKYKPVNLGQGFPDFPPPSHVIQNLADVALSNNILLNQYTRSMGHVRLVEALAKLYQPHFVCQAEYATLNKELLEATFLAEHALDPLANVLVSGGAYGSLFAAFSALLNPGDECIIMEPSFDCYGPMTNQAGGVPVYVQLKPKDDKFSSSADWVLDMKQLEASISPKSKILVLNTPHNPLGKVFSMKELTDLAEFCIRHNLICIADEVYEWMVFGEDGSKHIKIASLPGMWGRTVTVGSAGKTFGVTGWKLGWSVGPQELIAAMQSHQQNTVYNCPTPIQEAVARSLEQEMVALQLDAASVEKECYLRSLRHQLQAKSEDMARALRKANMRPIVPQSGYFMVADISCLPVTEEFTQADWSEDFQTNEWLMKTNGICGIPQSVFYNTTDSKKLGAKYLRFCHAKNEDTLEKAFTILKNLK